MSSIRNFYRVVAGVFILGAFIPLLSQSAPVPETGPVSLRGFVQTVGYFGLTDDSETYIDQFLMRRARLDLREKFGEHTEARLHAELAGTPTLLDVYLQFNPFDALSVRVGIFKSPVSQERLQPVSCLLLDDFAYTASVAPNRDIGLQLSGKIASGIFAYQVALLNGAQDGLSSSDDKSDSKDITGRIVLAPFMKNKENILNSLNIGMGASYGEQKDEVLPSVRTPGRTSVFEYNKSSKGNGTIYRFAPQAQVFTGKFSLLSEYILVNRKVRDTTGNSGALENSAWTTTLGFVLLGGNRSAKGFKTETPFSIVKGNIGSLELVSRIHAFHADDKTFEGFASSSKSVHSVISIDGGLNWHINNNARLLLAYSHSLFEKGTSTGDRPAEQILTFTANTTF